MIDFQPNALHRQVNLSCSRFWSSFDVAMMKHALALARQGAKCGEVPVGAVVVADEKVIGMGFNCPISTQDSTAHAEIIAIRQACQTINNYRLPKNSTLYVTLEPCTMCFGAMIHARVGRLVFGANEPKAGVVTSQLMLPNQTFYNHVVHIQAGLLKKECSAILSDFFKHRRANKKKAKLSDVLEND